MIVHHSATVQMGNSIQSCERLHAQTRCVGPLRAPEPFLRGGRMYFLQYALS